MSKNTQQPQSRPQQPEAKPQPEVTQPEAKPQASDKPAGGVRMKNGPLTDISSLFMEEESFMPDANGVFMVPDSQVAFVKSLGMVEAE